MMRQILSFLLVALSCSAMYAQVDMEAAPRAFLIGEHEEVYEQLVTEHKDQLLNVCQNSMDKAFEYWTALLVDLENYAEEKEFDIKGTKVWINVFWNADGTIRNIVYYPKPNSKNMDFQLLSNMLSEFAATYQYEVSSNKPFSHYGSAAFPTFSSIAVDK